MPTIRSERRWGRVWVLAQKYLTEGHSGSKTEDVATNVFHLAVLGGLCVFAVCAVVYVVFVLGIVFGVGDESVGRRVAFLAVRLLSYMAPWVWYSMKTLGVIIVLALGTAAVTWMRFCWGGGSKRAGEGRRRASFSETELAKLPDLEEIRRRVSGFSASLVAIREDPGGGTPEWGASGTFIKVRDWPCILTAQHVVHHLKRYKELGLVVTSGAHHFSIRMDQMTALEITERFEDKWGPDLAALLLPRDRGNNIEAWSKAFYNLDLHHDDIDLSLFPNKATAAILPRDRSSPLLLWAIAGVPAERSEFGQRISRVRGVVGLSGKARQILRGGFQYLDLGIVYEAGTEPPKSFQGMSGGGLWLLPYNRTPEGALSWSGKALLAGVAFYESDRQRNARFVRCHGPLDLYGRAYERIVREVERVQGK